MKPSIARTLAVAFALCAVATPAFAYIGPGAGIGVIGTVLAIIGAFVLLIVGFVWYPVKRLLRSRREKAAMKRDGEVADATEAER